MDRGDDLRAVANRCRNALNRAGANVADREHAVAAGFERQEAGPRQFVASQHEAAVVELESRGGEPIGVRLGADEGEEVTDRLAASPSL